jgi:hypothetical protein
MRTLRAVTHALGLLARRSDKFRLLSGGHNRVITFQCMRRSNHRAILIAGNWKASRSVLIKPQNVIYRRHFNFLDYTALAQMVKLS